MSIEPYNTLVKLVARAFYDDFTARDDNQSKAGRHDNSGIAVVVLEGLTRRQWVREEDLAKDLKLHLKQLRRTLQFLEEEKLVTRDHRKETAKGVKAYGADNLTGREGEENIRLHTHSYCCLDYAQIHDMVRYRMLQMKKKLKDEFDNNKTVKEYICPKCERRYDALDANRLISLEDGSFHCERCNTELESDILASKDNGDGDDNARRQHSEKLRELLQKMEAELKPLTDQLSRIKGLEAPDYGTLQAWELANASNPSANDYSRSGHGGTPMPFLGETKVEVTFSGGEEKGEIKSENALTKVFPQWMLSKNLTNEQRGGANQEQEEAAKREQINNISIDADVGPSSSRKRQHDDDDEWEEISTTGETFKVGLNVKAAEHLGDEDDAGIDWEEG